VGFAGEQVFALYWVQAGAGLHLRAGAEPKQGSCTVV